MTCIVLVLLFCIGEPRTFLIHSCLLPPLLLDVYVFGVGSGVNTDNINELASKKPGETHSFKLKDGIELQEAFESMIGNESPHFNYFCTFVTVGKLSVSFFALL